LNRLLDPTEYTYIQYLLTLPLESVPGSFDVDFFFEENVTAADRIRKSFEIDLCAATEFVEAP
jgi:hypothetical protein